MPYVYTKYDIEIYQFSKELLMKDKLGFVLISVLLITTITSMVAFSAIAESRLQEKVAGAQKKSINARFKAEQGIFSGYDYIKSQHQLALLTPEEIVSTIEQQIQQTDDTGSIDIIDPQELDGEYTFISKGTHQGAVAYLKTKIITHDINGESGFNDAIVGCEGVVLSGSGAIDSFDSSKGFYNATYQENGQSLVNKNNKANVATLGVASTDNNGDVSYQGADITLSGDSPIHGDVNVTGDFFSSGSAHIEGSLNANGNVGFQGKNVSSTGSHIVTGDVSLGGDANINSNTIGGNISVMGNATDTQNVDGTVTFGEFGSISGDSHLIAQDVSLAGPNLAMGECDTLNLLPHFINKGNNIAPANISAGMKKQLSGLDSLDSLIFETTETVKKAEILAANSTDGTKVPLLTQEMFVLGENKPRDVFVFESFHLRSRLITIKGDVTLVIKGEFETSGDKSGFQFEPGDTSSSLTIITEGSVKIGSESSMFTNAQSIDKNVPLSIFSSFDSASNNDKHAVSLGGKTDAYARVYAPKGDVITTNSGHIMGAVHGKTVEVSGAGGIHYDEALQKVADIKSNKAGDVLFVSVHDYYI